MSATFDSPQFERDLRSAGKEFKRSKDSRTKWSYGARNLSGVRVSWDGEVTSGNDGMLSKYRPNPKISDERHPIRKDSRNIVKGTNMQLPQGRVRSKVSAFEEIEDAGRTSVLDLLPSPRAGGAADGFLYSFDNVDSPAPVLSLDVFVKAKPRETEKLVEKEYEVLDENGEALKGRKARQNLRKASNSPPSRPAAIQVIEDDGFELV